MDDESRAESPVLETKKVSNQCTSLHIILSIIVALLAIGGSYFFTISNEDQGEEVLVDHEPMAADEFDDMPDMDVK